MNHKISTSDLANSSEISEQQTHSEKSETSGHGKTAIELVQIMGRVFSGPLPPPEILEKYEKVLPGSADRIIKMAESQSQHRQELENKVIRHDINQANRGQIFAFILFLLIILGAILLIYTGRSIEGFAALVGTLITGGSIYLFGKKQQVKELKEKQQKL